MFADTFSLIKLTWCKNLAKKSVMNRWNIATNLNSSIKIYRTRWNHINQVSRVCKWCQNTSVKKLRREWRNFMNTLMRVLESCVRRIGLLFLSQGSQRLLNKLRQFKKRENSGCKVCTNKDNFTLTATPIRINFMRVIRIWLINCGSRNYSMNCLTSKRLPHNCRMIIMPSTTAAKNWVSLPKWL